MPRKLTLADESARLNEAISEGPHDAERQFTIRLRLTDALGIVEYCMDNEIDTITEGIERIAQLHLRGNVHVAQSTDELRLLDKAAILLGATDRHAAAQMVLQSTLRDFLAYLEGRAVYDRETLEAAIAETAAKTANKKKGR